MLSALRPGHKSFSWLLLALTLGGLEGAALFFGTEWN